MGANATCGHYRAVTVASISNDEIRALCADGYVNADDAYDAIYNDHTQDGRDARERCANTFNALRVEPEYVSLVTVEACS
jgi:hypothetical protein